ASFKDRPLRNGVTRHTDPCSDVPALLREAGGPGWTGIDWLGLEDIIHQVSGAGLGWWGIKWGLWE
ncbi:hypothetical protein KUCAC02_023501, partial [Chaenocephalus aceratus]